jgi:hypothetical protein
VETIAYICGLVKEIHVYLKNHVFLVCTIGQTFLGLFAVVFLLVGHYPYYRNFSIIKSCATQVFPLGFF